MSDTTIYFITPTAGPSTEAGAEDASFVIQPKTIDGPVTGSIRQHTDLVLYGNGTENWGEKFNQNFYRLLENFACPNIGSTQATPADRTSIQANGGALAEHDTYGMLNGINYPIIGQTWYNTTDENLYVCTGYDTSGNAEWKYVAADASGGGTVTPGSPSGTSDYSGLSNKPGLTVTLTNGVQGTATISELDAGSNTLTISCTVPGLVHNHSLDSLSNVVLSSPAPGQVLKYNGSNWVNGVDEGGVSGSADGNDYVSSMSFSSGTGVLTLYRTGGLPSLTQSLDGRWATESHSHAWTSIDNRPTSIGVNLTGDVTGSGSVTLGSGTNTINITTTGGSGGGVTITGAATTIDTENLTANRALISNGSGKVAVSAVTSTELSYLDGATSNIQTQINGLINAHLPGSTVNIGGVIAGSLYNYTTPQSSSQVSFLATKTLNSTTRIAVRTEYYTGAFNVTAQWVDYGTWKFLGLSGYTSDGELGTINWHGLWVRVA